MKTGIRYIDNRKGVSIVLLALAIVVLFGFAALAVDVGHLYNVKNQLQTAADASALAAVAKLSGNGITQPDARDAAQQVGLQNFADVASSNIGGVANAGDPIPITLQRNNGNDANGDIVVGNWDEDTYTFTPATGEAGEIVNAVKVVARRTGATPEQPNVQNFFARIFSIPSHLGVNFGQNFSLANVGATAIAARGELGWLPIAVNEYWDESTDTNGNPTNSSGTAYGQAMQHYPQSFMRQTNADFTTSLLGGKTFAILGIDAGSNNASYNLNSFVDVLHRNRSHTPRTNNWYQVVQNSVSGSCASGCTSSVVPVPGGVTAGDVNPGKWDQNFTYLFEGIPDNVIPPNAVREVIRDDTNPYTHDNYKPENGNDQQNDPLSCPYASLPYFSSSGNPVQKTLKVEESLYNGINFRERYPRGSRFMVMVYDGTLTPNPDPSQANVITIIGYGLIELDGYSNSPYHDGDTLNTGGPNGGTGGTAYGHAIPHNLTNGMGVADVTDRYLIQPIYDPRVENPGGIPVDTVLDEPLGGSTHQGTCQFTDIIRQALEINGTYKLVDPTLHYGVQ